jgi:hypothetical protein
MVVAWYLFWQSAAPTPHEQSRGLPCQAACDYGHRVCGHPRHDSFECHCCAMLWTALHQQVPCHRHIYHQNCQQLSVPQTQHQQGVPPEPAVNATYPMRKATNQGVLIRWLRASALWLLCRSQGAQAYSPNPSGADCSSWRQPLQQHQPFNCIKAKTPRYPCQHSHGRPLKGRHRLLRRRCPLLDKRQLLSARLLPAPLLVHNSKWITRKRSPTMIPTMEVATQAAPAAVAAAADVHPLQPLFKLQGAAAAWCHHYLSLQHPSHPQLHLQPQQPARPRQRHPFLPLQLLSTAASWRQRAFLRLPLALYKLAVACRRARTAAVACRR